MKSFHVILVLLLFDMLLFYSGSMAQNWSEPVAVTSGAGDDHNLDIQRDPLLLGYEGYWVAWDHTEGGNTDIFHAHFYPGISSTFIEVHQVTDGPSVEEKPSVMVNGAFQSGVFFQSPYEGLSAVFFAERTDTTFSTPWLTLYSDVGLYEPLYCGIITDIGIIPALYLRSDSTVVPVTYEYYIEWPYQITPDTAYCVDVINSGHPVLHHDGDWTSLGVIPIQLQKYVWETVIGGRSEIGYYFQTVDTLLNVHTYQGWLPNPGYDYYAPELAFQDYSAWMFECGVYLEREVAGTDIAYAGFDEETGDWTTPEPRFDLPGNERRPAACGDIVVFECDGTGDWNIAFWHPSFETPELVDTDPSEDRNPRLVVDLWTNQYYVFWESNRDGNWKIYYSHRDVVGVEPEPLTPVPKSFHVSIHPNPGNAEFKIELGFPASGQVRAGIYDLQGRLVSEVYDGWLQNGSQSFVWNASGKPSGIYLLQVESAGSVHGEKIVILK